MSVVDRFEHDDDRSRKHISMNSTETKQAAALLDYLQPGMRVYVPGSTGEPRAALEILASAPERCAGVEFITSFLPGINTFDLGLLGPEARFTAFFMQPSLKQAAEEGRVYFPDKSYSGIAQWLADQPVDLALATVCPAHDSKLLGLGPAVEFTPIALEGAAVKVAVSNRQIPWLPGSIHYDPDTFDLIIEGNRPPPVYTDPQPSTIYTRIGALVAELVPDGATLQTGLGQAPAAVLDALTDRRDLNLHTGVFSDSLLRLAAAGAFRSASVMTSGVAVGTSEFYENLPEFPDITYAPVSKTHSAEVLDSLPRFFVVNSALEVDLQGNINAEFLNNRRISGRGGLPDFATAGHRSSDGASIIVLPSTDRSGRHSRIVGQLSSIATVKGGEIDYVITEQGCACLTGQSATERAKAMLAIAAPKHRKRLNQIYESLTT